MTICRQEALWPILAGGNRAVVGIYRGFFLRHNR